jgi:hypothetical protein
MSILNWRRDGPAALGEAKATTQEEIILTRSAARHGPAD